MTEKLERQLPVEIGGEKLKEGREILPAVEVANEVSWVNNKMNLPFDLKVGEATKLGMFLTPMFDVGSGLNSGNSENNRKALELLLDVKTMVAQELNIDPEKFTYDDYVEWLIKITAINLARMRYNNWVSGYLTTHNITLDGRFVDLDSQVRSYFVSIYEEEFRRLKSEKVPKVRK